MDGPATEPQTQIEAPTEFPDEALTEPEDGNLTPAQFAARISAKVEEAYQDSGMLVPPGLDPEGVEPISVENEVVEEEPPTVVVTDAPEEEGEEGEEEEAPPEEDEAVEPAEDEAEEDAFYVGRYRDREAAETALEEKDATINRLYQELHQRGQQIEQALQANQQAQPLDTGAWREWASEVVEAGAGERGALQALEHGGRDGYNIYYAAWHGEDPVAAVAFNNEVVLSLAEQTAAMQTAPLLEQQKPGPNEEAEIAKARVAAQHDDFDQYTDEMDRLITEPGALPEQTKQFLSDLARSGLEGKMYAWDYLLLAAQAHGAPNRRKARAEEKKQRKASADRAKVAATVSSAEGSAVRTPLPEAELQVIRYKNQMRAKWDLPLLPEE